MQTIWVYGCSFSEPFQLEGKDKNGDYLPVERDNNGNRILKADYWGSILARNLGFEVRTRSWAGCGWNKIQSEIQKTWMSWDTDDIIIISPSFFSRPTIVEFQDWRTIKYVSLLKSIKEIQTYNEERWLSTIRFTQRAGFRVYTWLVDAVEFESIPENTIPAPDGDINWQNWMMNHKEYWTSLPGEVYEKGDWHFNAECHKVVAERMYNYIKYENTNN